MAKSELGTKRLCASCGAKFYDLNKDPIICPKCEAVFVIPVVTTRASRSDAARAPVKNVAVEPETADADFVSLEDADAEASGGKKAAAGDDADVEDDTGDDAGEDDTFIEETDDNDDDVTDIIGDAGDKEEES